jgi:hypothetical protein
MLQIPTLNDKFALALCDKLPEADIYKMDKMFQYFAM